MESISKPVPVTELKPGDILVSSWGYDQTNVSFYQVIKLAGKTMVILRGIHSTLVKQTGMMSGERLPLKDSFVKEKEFRRKIQTGFEGRLVIGICSFECAYIWDGTPQYCNWYG